MRGAGEFERRLGPNADEESGIAGRLRWFPLHGSARHGTARYVARLYGLPVAGLAFPSAAQEPGEFQTDQISNRPDPRR